jgi:hypothetical protein
VDISELLYGYFELIFFQRSFFTNSLLRHLWYAIERDLDNKGLFTINQLNFILHLFSKINLNLSEIRIRKYVIDCVVSKLPSMKSSEIMSAVIDLKKMDLSNFDQEDILNIKLIGERILEGIDQVEERSIYDFLRAEPRNHHSVFRKINDELTRLIFMEIEENGQTEMERDAVFYMLMLLSEHLQFTQLSPVDQKKVMAFVQDYSKHLSTEKN